MNILIIDGPARGKMMESTGTAFKVVLPPAIEAGRPPDEPIEFNNETYFVHQFRIMGFFIAIGSINLDIKDINDFDVVDLLLSDNAKAACRRI